MSDNPILPQYMFLFRLLRECSVGYQKALAEAMIQDRQSWNEAIASFEIDVYMLSHLVSSLTGLNHNKQVVHDVLLTCETGLIVNHPVELFEQGSTKDDIGELIEDRAETYFRFDVDPLKKIECLRRNIASSVAEKKVKKEVQVLVINDIFCEQANLMKHVALDMEYSGQFVSALKHIFQHTKDIRTCSEDTLLALARKAEKIDANHSRPKRRWRLW